MDFVIFLQPAFLRDSYVSKQKIFEQKCMYSALIVSLEGSGFSYRWLSPLTLRPRQRSVTEVSKRNVT